MRSGERGLSAVELSVVVALLSVLASAAAPELAAWRARQAALGAGASLIVQIEGVRAAAVTTRRAHALVFRRVDGEILWAVAVDGDGDGVRSADLDSGIDRLYEPGRPLSTAFPGMTVGLAPGVPAVPGGTRPRGDLPLAPTGILTASPGGTLSTGTVYLCHRRGVCFAARIYGPGGRVGGWSYGTGGEGAEGQGADEQGAAGWARRW